MTSECQTKLRIYPTKEYVDINYLIDTIFKTTEKNKDNNISSTAAIKIIDKAAKRGDDGLWCCDWKDQVKELNVTPSQYFHIIKTLKNARILTKSKGKLYLINGFGNHLSTMASAFNRYMLDKGITRIK
jgi:hypothetical protein